MDIMLFILIVVFTVTGIIKTIDGNHFENEPNCNQSIVFAISGHAHIMRYDLTTGDIHTLTPSTNLQQPIAVAADQSEGLVFFIDVQFKQMYKKNFKEGTDTILIKNLPTGSIADGIAVDPVEKLLFYSDYADNILDPVSDYAYIRRMDYNGNNGVDILSANDNLHRPRAILLDTYNRKIYYTDWGNTPHIARADYDGSNIQVLRNLGLLFPNGLAEDFANDRIFYCDAGTDTIAWMNTDGSGHTIVVQNDPDFHFFDIIRVHDELFLSNWDTENSAVHRTVQGVIRINFDASIARSAVTIDGPGPIKVNGLANICFPVDEYTSATSSTLPTTFSTTATSSTSASTSATSTTSTTSTVPSTTSTTASTTPSTSSTTSATSTIASTTSTTASTTTSTSTSASTTSDAASFPPSTSTTASTTSYTASTSSTTYTTASTTSITASTTSTTANVTATEDYSGRNSASSSDGSNSNISLMIIIGMSLLAAVVIMIIVGVTLCCICMRKNKSPTTSQESIEHTDSSFDRPDYITPISINHPGQSKNPYAQSNLNSQHILQIREPESGVYEKLQIYDTIRN